jgi:hypothetical protein
MIAIDGVVDLDIRALAQVQAELVTEEIEVDPTSSAPPLPAPEHAPIE